MKDVDCVVFANQVRSNRRVIQMAGRASRVAPDKECGYVMVPYDWDTNSNGEMVLDPYSQTALAHMWEYYHKHNVQLHAQHYLEKPAPEVQTGASYRDDSMVDLAQANSECSEMSLEKFMQQIAYVGPNLLSSPEFIKKQLELVIYDKTTDSFMEQLPKLTAYQLEHGNCDIPHLDGSGQQIPSEHPYHELSKFVKSCRRLDKEGRLSTDRKEALKDLGVSLTPIEDTFTKKLELYAQYREDTGEVHVHGAYITSCKTHLGHWYATQKGKFFAGRLNPQREAALADVVGSPLADIWVMRREEHEQRWCANCEGFALYYQKMSQNPPKDVMFQDRRIGPWIQKLRRKVKDGKIKEDWKLEALADIVGDIDGWANPVDKSDKTFIPAEQRMELEREGFAFSKARAAEITGDDAFVDYIKLLRQFRQQHEGEDPKSKFKYCGAPLGSWFHKQKDLFRRGGLKPARKELLERELGLPLDVLWTISSKLKVTDV